LWSPAAEAYGSCVCLIVFLCARGVVLLASRLAGRRGRKQPPGGRDKERDDELVLAA
jgi:hypothetical protein